jgi:hypothetical protein
VIKIVVILFWTVRLIIEMRFRVGVLLCSLALLQIPGGHCACLQMGAWAGMVMQCSQQAGVIAGRCQTFDGEHLCPVWKAIQERKKQEEKKAPPVEHGAQEGVLSRLPPFPGLPGLG